MIKIRMTRKGRIISNYDSLSIDDAQAKVVDSGNFMDVGCYFGALSFWWKRKI